MKSTRTRSIILHVAAVLVALALVAVICNVSLERGSSGRIAIATFELFVILLAIVCVAMLVARGVGTIARGIREKKRPSRIEALLIAGNLALIIALARIRTYAKR